MGMLFGPELCARLGAQANGVPGAPVAVVSPQAGAAGIAPLLAGIAVPAVAVRATGSASGRTLRVAGSVDLPASEAGVLFVVAVIGYGFGCCLGSGRAMIILGKKEQEQCVIAACNNSIRWMNDDLAASSLERCSWLHVITC